ncbi:HD domain-containing protein [Bacillus sp. 03113]|uniref:HD domain-containing protein n=1 Tax=Bacillus sp. 03113 TaxID=2578211 RepID=UPI0011411942|nr:HD domain-containing protein [Bacillus sp. 03113]
MKEIIEITELFVQKNVIGDSTGHDWYHIDRVRKMALYIHEREKKGDAFIIEMAALLHDIPDEKLVDSKKEGELKLSLFLHSLPIEPSIKQLVTNIILSISYKGGYNTPLKSVEAMIVQDADRIDAIGAIGIARAFAYGGKKGQAIYDPALTVRPTMTVEEYRHGQSSSIHHFYEKLLKITNLLNTDTARQIAEQRHHFMKLFLTEFYREWNDLS